MGQRRAYLISEDHLTLKRWPRIIAWLASLALLIASVRLASLTAYYWWAAGFRDNPSSQAYQVAGNWYFAATLASFMAALCLLVASVYRTIRGTTQHYQGAKESPPLPS